MSKKRIKSKVEKLRFGAIIKKLREDFSKLSESRRSPKYPIENILMSVFPTLFLFFLLKLSYFIGIYTRTLHFLQKNGISLRIDVLSLA